MGQMALGYGSEFHLLRWLGRHRNEFDYRIKQLLNIDNVTWLDFDFDEGKTIPDKELTGLSFLDKNISGLISSTWTDEWPKSGKVMNWDLVGYTVKNNTKTWKLIEAKAHKGELSQACKATSDKSKMMISDAITKAAQNYGIKANSNWINKYYQLSNRIYIVDLLKRNDINAKLINIYFVGDWISKSRQSPQSIVDWVVLQSDMKRDMGIDAGVQSKIGIFDLFLDVDK
jgi:hypothetical protein